MRNLLVLILLVATVSGQCQKKAGPIKDTSDMICQQFMPKHPVRYSGKRHAEFKPVTTSAERTYFRRRILK